jgi:hypothetical protein
VVEDALLAVVAVWIEAAGNAPGDLSRGQVGVCAIIGKGRCVSILLSSSLYVLRSIRGERAPLLPLSVVPEKSVTGFFGVEACAERVEIDGEIEQSMNKH